MGLATFAIQRTAIEQRIIEHPPGENVCRTTKKSSNSHRTPIRTSTPGVIE